MGYMTSWVAVRGDVPGDLFDELGLIDLEGRSVAQESDFAAAALRGGWVTVLVRDTHPGYPYRPDLLARLSRRAELVTCHESTYGPESASARWCNGQQVWKAEHLAETTEVTVEGDVPDVFDELMSAAGVRSAQGSGIDEFYEVPVELAKSITGFRQDEAVRGAPPAIRLGMDVKAFALTPVEYSWTVTELDDEDQLRAVMGEAIHQFHRSEFPGTRLFNRAGADDNGRRRIDGGTVPAVMAISGFDRWRPEFEATVARRVAEVAPHAKLTLNWNFPDAEQGMQEADIR
ncbi:hypothetical protein ACGFQG_15915 [Nocardia fluminea]|uniref:hypothetical protein n=1 Tax=Nocardia fluminea TaxID=134984 RepID=UPI003718D93B